MRKSGIETWKLVESIVHIVVGTFFKIIGKELSEKTFIMLMQFVKFGIVGVSNTLISYIIYVGSLIVFRQVGVFSQMDYLVAKVLEFVLSVLWSFYWNNKMVFIKEDGEERSIVKSLLKTYVSYSFTGLFLSSILLYFWVQIVGISEFIAPIINLVISVPLNFVINKFWAFK